MQLIQDIEHTLRGSFFGFTAMLPLIAAGTIDPDPTAAQITALLCIAAAFHVFGYLHNDLIDLPIDRTQPQRANDPLITGRLKVSHAWLLVAAQIPVSFAIAASVGGNLRALLILSLGYLTTIAYNLYGKRCRIPMLTDALQGVAWFCLATFGAVLVGGFNTLTFVIAAFGFAFILLINGVHGGLRDLANDFARGRMTTAIYFGAHPIDAVSMCTPAALRRFAAFALALVMLPGALCLLTNRFDYSTPTLLVVGTVWLSFNAMSLWYLHQVVKPHQTDRRRWIYAHQLPLLAPPLVLFLPALGWPLRLAVLFTWTVTLLLFSEPVNRLAGSIFRPISRLRRSDA